MRKIIGALFVVLALAAPQTAEAKPWKAGSAKVCDAGQTLVGKRCAPAQEDTTCPAGTNYQDGECVPPEDEVVCDAGQLYVDGTCRPE